MKILTRTYYSILTNRLNKINQQIILTLLVDICINHVVTSLYSCMKFVEINYFDFCIG